MKSRSYKIATLLLFYTFGIGHAQTDTAEDSLKTPWTNEVVGTFNISQTSFDNWVQGGENSMAWQLNLNCKFEYARNQSTWSNSGKFTYGRLKAGHEDSKKSIDEIKMESVYKYDAKIYVNPYAAVNFLSQFAPGYKYTTDTKDQISAFMDPGYLQESFGVGYDISKSVKTRAGAAFKQTITNDYPNPYSDDPETEELETLKSEVGAESVTDVHWKMAENILLTSKLELFSTLKALDETDVQWDLLWNAKISSLVSVNFNVKLFYDKDISPKRQLKQSLAAGVSYAFL